MSEKEQANDGIGFTGLLTIVFIILKLTHAINWSWWWVLAPVWISAGLTILLLIFALAVLAKLTDDD